MSGLRPVTLLRNTDLGVGGSQYGNAPVAGKIAGRQVTGAIAAVLMSGP